MVKKKKVEGDEKPKENPPPPANTVKRSFCTCCSLIPSVLTTLVILIGIIHSCYYGKLGNLKWPQFCDQTSKSAVPNAKPKYILYNAHGRRDHLKHVIAVLDRFGYEETSGEDWSLMWAHDYPFNNQSYDFKNKLKPCQKVNHLPGCGYITNKVDLSTTKLKYIPRAFKLPAQEKELREFSAANPEKRFVQKHNQHRHIKVRTLEEIDFKDEQNFVQEFIDNPLLVDGFKFDIGVYTIVTSIDPLRAYIYNGEILFRFCPVPYYPFDPGNVDKYIVGDDYLPIWKVPSLSVFYNNLKHGMRESFDGYLKAQNRDPAKIWAQVEDSIRLMLLNKEKHLAEVFKRYRRTRNFFELMRIDFVVDNDLNVFMMEANMSPNLSSAHFPPNQLLYEQVLFNSLKLAGVAFPQQNGSCNGDLETNRMMSSDKNIVINSEACSTMPCLESCAPVKCMHCFPCLDGEDKAILNAAVMEHVNRGDTKRIFPPDQSKIANLSDAEFQKLSPRNQFIVKWYEGKCAANPSWCN